MRRNPAVSVGAGAIWMQAYDAVTTRGGRYVQGGVCTTVGVIGVLPWAGIFLPEPRLRELIPFRRDSAVKPGGQTVSSQ